jgi:hypothetical protein
MTDSVFRIRELGPVGSLLLSINGAGDGLGGMVTTLLICRWSRIGIPPVIKPQRAPVIRAVIRARYRYVNPESQVPRCRSSR